jgi:hypothetical protein
MLKNKFLDMKKVILLTILSGMSYFISAQTMFKINQYNIIYNEAWMPVFTLYSGHAITEKLGFSAYFYVNGAKGSSWGEGLVGPTWTPVQGISFGLLAGFQSNEDQLFRISPLVNVNRGKFSGFASFEMGGERHRWDVMAFYQAKPFKVGGELIRFYQMYAAGPRFEITFFKKQPITLFYSGLWDWNNSEFASMFGIYTSFSQSSRQ